MHHIVIKTLLKVPREKHQVAKKGRYIRITPDYLMKILKPLETEKVYFKS